MPFWDRVELLGKVMVQRHLGGETDGPRELKTEVRRSSGDARWLSAELKSKPATRGGLHRIQPVLGISLAVGRCGGLSAFSLQSRNELAMQRCFSPVI